MDISGIILGATAAFSAYNLMYCLIGCFLGTAIGVLPGLGPVATISMLLPITFGLPPETALIMLAGIFYGAQYGGSTTAILVNLPGESSSVVTALDGYQMARKGRAGQALAAAAIGSFIAGTLATLLVGFVAPILSLFALKFGPAEYFSLMVLGLIAAIVLAHGSVLHAFGMMLLGLLLGLVGTDVNSGVQRFTGGTPELLDGISFVIVAMGIFGIGEIIANLGDRKQENTELAQITRLMPTLSELRAMLPPVLRGTVLGSVLGILPGGGATLASFSAYALEKKMSSKPEEFGHGALAGLAGPESANNAAAQTSFIPMLTLGIPSNPVMALMIGALIMQGIQPGPSVIHEQPMLFWAIVISMWIGNVMLLVLNLPLIGIWVRMISVRYSLLFPAILVFCAVGVFSINKSLFDVYLMVGFGVAGYVLRRLDCEPAPLLLGFILGPMMEEYLRRAMLLAKGDPTVFLTHPISAVMLLVAAVLLLTMAAPAVRRKRAEAFVEE